MRRIKISQIFPHNERLRSGLRKISPVSCFCKFTIILLLSQYSSRAFHKKKSEVEIFGLQLRLCKNSNSAVQLAKIAQDTWNWGNSHTFASGSGIFAKFWKKIWNWSPPISSTDGIRNCKNYSITSQSGSDIARYLNLKYTFTSVVSENH